MPTIKIRASRDLIDKLKSRGISFADVFWSGIEQLAPDLLPLRRPDGAPKGNKNAAKPDGSKT